MHAVFIYYKASVTVHNFLRVYRLMGPRKRLTLLWPCWTNGSHLLPMATRTRLLSQCQSISLETRPATTETMYRMGNTSVIYLWSLYILIVTIFSVCTFFHHGTNL